MNHPQPQIPYHEYSTSHFWSKSIVESISSFVIFDFTYTIRKSIHSIDFYIWIDILIYCPKDQIEYHGTFYYITDLVKSPIDPSKERKRELLLNSIIDIVDHSTSILEQHIHETAFPNKRGCISNTNKFRISKMCKYWFEKYYYDKL